MLELSAADDSCSGRREPTTSLPSTLIATFELSSVTESISQLQHKQLLLDKVVLLLLSSTLFGPSKFVSDKAWVAQS